ncbi:hypothetical protein [Plantactinospora endophytica]|uniref:Uncharacterized protein n=1 Tax=Plantactinospora endophytica TaxID=673535 RepID=A0ABQ4EET0_9ACTN|nr:hypothetical protein [Plantactinospora endophytica]GIG93225.1 hypothetical protein Pen02_81610 [Plantactinospora endophytica]
MTRNTAGTVRAKTFVLCGTGEPVPVGACEITFARDRRVQGFIQLYIDDHLILGPDTNDTIDALWSLMVTYVADFMQGRIGVLNFPERRFTFALDRVGRGNALVRFVDQEEKRTALSGEKELLEALTSGAVEFFSAVLESSPIDEWSYRRDLNTALRLRQECSALE